MEVAASVIAVVQISGTVLQACKSYIDAFQDYPKDLRLIYVEISSIKAVFEALDFFDRNDAQDSAALEALMRPEGPIEGCKRAMGELSQLLPRAFPQRRTNKSKRQKLESALVTLAWPLKCDRARKLLDELNTHKATINMRFTGHLRHELRYVKDVVRKIDQSLTDSQRQECCDWLEIVNPSSNHNAAVDLYVEGTGDWVFRSSPWREWINRNTRILWMHGIPGAGKTVLVAHIIRHIFSSHGDKNNMACVYFYCYHARNQDDSIPLLRWLLGQLCRKASNIPESIYKAFELKHDPDRALLLDCLAEMVQQFDTIWLIVDALDESQERENILSLLQRLYDDDRFGSIQVFAASREYFDIEQVMLTIADPLSLANPWVEKDIESYVGRILSTQPPFKRWPAEISLEVQGTLSRGAKGMFRWAVCQLDILRRLKSTMEVRKALLSLPETLDETYERIFSYIHPSHRELVRHTIHWIYTHDAMYEHINQRNISSHVLLNAYEWLQEESEPSDLSLVDLGSLRESCGCLVTWAVETRQDGSQMYTAKIAHYTVREFLESNRSRGETSFFSLHPREVYTSVLDSVLGRADETKLSEISGLDGPLTDLNLYCSVTAFAAFRWLDKFIKPSIAFEFLDPRSERYPRLGIMSLYGVYEGYQWEYIDWSKWKGDDTGIGLALQLIELKAFTLLDDCLNLYESAILTSTFSLKIDAILEPSFDLIDEDFGLKDPELFFHGTILDYFALFYYDNTRTTSAAFDSLLHHADPSVDLTSILPFYAAGSRYHQRNGTANFLTTLLQRGADPNSDDFRVTPLQISCLLGDKNTVRLLLQGGADPNFTGNPSQSEWDDICILRSFRVLHGLSPLRIARRFRFKFNEDDRWLEMERLLLECQAEDFNTTSHRVDDVIFLKYYTAYQEKPLTMGKG